MVKICLSIPVGEVKHDKVIGERAFKEVSKLPEVEQNALAKWVMEELEAEGKWEKAFAGSEDILDKLADEALTAHKQGKTKPLNIIFTVNSQTTDGFWKCYGTFEYHISLYISYPASLLTFEGGKHEKVWRRVFWDLLAGPWGVRQRRFSCCVSRMSASACLAYALAFGLTVLTMAFAIGHISGCHLNPAVSIGLWAGGRFPAKELLPYIVAQVLGGIVAGGVLYLIASGKAGFDLSAGFASNGYGAHSPGGYSLLAALITEVVMTMMFLLVILGATDKRAPQGFAPIAIGLCLTLIHLISIPVTNTSVNPARSTGVAVFVGDWAISQLWLFWVAPIIGGMLGAAIYRFIGSEKN